METVIAFKIFRRFPNIAHGISTRKFGSMKKGRMINYRNFVKFADILRINSDKTVFMKQVHGNKVKIVKNAEKKLVNNVDGVITKLKRVFLCVTTADCLPIVFYDTKNQIVGALHAGYRGILSGILEQMFSNLKKIGSYEKDIVVVVGPSIGACCYNVDFERIKKFESRFPDFSGMYKHKDGQYYLDLKKVVLKILLKLGLKENNIEVSPICTKSNVDRFYSYRGDTKETFGEFVTVIGMV